MWVIFWVLCMLGLIVAVSVVALREKKARQTAIKKMTPQAIDNGAGSPLPSADDGFGQQDPLAGFDGSQSSFDEAAFK